MWDEEDGFYYDVLRLPDGSATRLKVRSMVGLFRSAPPPSSSHGSGSGCRVSAQIFQERLRRMPELLESIHPTGPGHLGVADRGIFALVNPEQAAPDPVADARRERIPESLRHPCAFPLPCRPSLCFHMSKARNTG